MSDSRQHLRRNLRRKRRRLSVSRRRAHAHRLALHLMRHPLFQRARHIAVYLPNDGEMDLSMLIERAWRMGKSCYLPRLRGQAVEFAAYLRHAQLRRNRFGIPEPLPGARLRSPYRLDLVLMPLVGFDRQGNRLGMGGGYYDRSFAAHRTSRGRCKPYLLGVAYGFQALSTLPAENWDVPLWGVATEQGIMRARTLRKGA